MFSIPSLWNAFRFAYWNPGRRAYNKGCKRNRYQGFYAITILAGFANRATVVPKKLSELGYIKISKDLSSGIEAVGFWLFWVCIAFFGFWLFAKFFGNFKALREEG